MKKSTRKILKTILPLSLGFFLIWYSLNSASPQERAELWSNIRLADSKWIWLSMIFGLLSHLSRAYRWQYLLEPLGFRPRFFNSFMAVMTGYLANFGVPRSGEVLRAATVTSYEEIPFEKAFGTIVSERIADLLMLLIVVLIGFLIQTNTLLAYFESHPINPFYGLLVLLALLLLTWIGFKIIQKSKIGLFVKIRKFLKGLLEGMKSILKMKHKTAFLLHTLFIWVMYILMFWIIKFTIPETFSLSFAGILTAFIVGSFAVTTTNGGIGVYPLAMGAVLLFFAVPEEAGKAFGWIVWSTQTILVIVLGGLSFLFLPIYNRQK